MQAATLLAQEIHRLVALRKSGVLDTPNEPEFDDLVHLAQQICGTPIALVSLVDENRQWFKAKIGLDVQETHRDLAFCAHAILTPELMVVEDTLKDERFQDNPLVTGEPHIRFYAGMPLQTSDGFNLGTVCVIDRKPRELTNEQQDSLRALGRQCARLLDLKMRMADLNSAMAQTEDYSHRLRKTLKNLRQSNQDLEDFAFVASHDLREPLRKMRMFSDLLGQHLGETCDEKTTDYLMRLRDAAKRMDDLVGDLLELARINNKGGKFEPLSLDSLLKSLHQEVGDELKAIGAHLKVEPLGQVIADPSQIRLLFLNLIGNSMKYRRPDVPLLITIAPKNATAQELIIELADNGIGFEPQHAESIFTLFKRLHGRGVFEGTGIGLSLCRRIAQRHGGTLEAMGTPGEGAVFTLRLPREPGSEST